MLDRAVPDCGWINFVGLLWFLAETIGKKRRSLDLASWTAAKARVCAGNASCDAAHADHGWGAV